jgi:uncharacterized RDD family membrane protein YckC
VRETVRVSDLVTGEAVALELRIAQLPTRLAAALIDLAVMGGAFLALALLAGLALADSTDDAAAAALFLSLFVLTFLTYPVAMETLTRGRTLGKMALGVRAVRDDGGPLTFRHALVRGLVGFVLERPGLILVGFGPGLALLVSVLSKRGKRIGDMAAGTMVVQDRAASRLVWVPWMPAPLAAWASTVDISRLDDELALLLRQFLGRAPRLRPDAREQLGVELATELGRRTAPPPPPGTPGWAYLSAVLAERRHREETRIAVAAGHPAPPMPVWPPPAAPYGAPYPGLAYPGPPPYAGGPPPGQIAAPPYAGGPAPYAGGPAPYAGGPVPYAGGPAPYPGGPAPYAGGSAPYAGGSAPYAGGSAPYGGGPVPDVTGSTPAVGSVIPAGPDRGGAPSRYEPPSGPGGAGAPDRTDAPVGTDRAATSDGTTVPDTTGTPGGTATPATAAGPGGTSAAGAGRRPGAAEPWPADGTTSSDAAADGTGFAAPE